MMAESGADAFSLRALAKRLGVDPAAIYRHYEDLDDLLREVGDRALAPATQRFQTSDDPVGDIRRLLLRLRNVQLASGVARLTSAGPTRYANELRITEVILDSCARLGLDEKRAVLVYHVLIEYTIGSATLDAPLAESREKRAQAYKRWRADYATVDRDAYPAIRAHARYLYPSAERVFETGLDALLAQLLP